ncbi:DUF551 domain-containing protein [Citrobacter sp. Cb005]|uniref:DUF551 domain-containing protein n=1 Tax=Citrobacter sp. Cb005 TaxID=2985007 RepID=UPI00257EC5D9|nr:DUF551 domain-containing protein [Citrobacter sp. Cb005]MDM3368080.1 DUF551 domain-containing protein [Citrobacter sp. Cb005]
MSTITKELAKLFRKITNSEIDAEGNAHVVLSPADSLLINNARIALASLEVEAVAYMHHSGQVVTREECCDDKIFAICCKVETPLYAAPQLPQPAVLSVPAAMEMDDDFDSAFEHGKAVGWNAYRAAMLQASNSPVTPDGWIPVSERMPEQDGNYWGWWSESKRQGPVWFIKSELQAQFQSSEITHWMPLPAAPQQEVK